MGVTGAEQPLCACYNTRQEFHKVVEFKNTGLVVYCHTKHKENVIQGDAVGNAINTFEDVFVVHNTKDEKIESVDLIPALEKRHISCPRCRQRFQHAQRLLQQVNSIDKGKVMGICDHCLKKEQSIKTPCNECDEVVNYFLSTSGEQREDTKQYIKIWLSQMRHLLKDSTSLEEPDNVKSRVHSELHIDQLFCYSPESKREPEVKQMFQSKLEARKSDTDLHKKVNDANLKEDNLFEKSLLLTQAVAPFVITQNDGKKLSKNYDESLMDVKEAIKRKHDLNLRKIIRPEIYEIPKIAPWEQREILLPFSKYSSESDIRMVGSSPVIVRKNQSRDLHSESNRLVKYGPSKISPKENINGKGGPKRKLDLILKPMGPGKETGELRFEQYRLEKYKPGKIKIAPQDSKEMSNKVNRRDHRYLTDEELKIQHSLPKHEIETTDQEVTETKMTSKNSYETEDVKKMLKKQFSFFFPKCMEKTPEILAPSSSELIQNTIEKIRQKAEKDKQKQIAEKKHALEVKKRQAEEQKRQVEVQNAEEERRELGNILTSGEKGKVVPEENKKDTEKAEPTLEFKLRDFNVQTTEDFKKGLRQKTESKDELDKEIDGAKKQLKGQFELQDQNGKETKLLREQKNKFDGKDAENENKSISGIKDRGKQEHLQKDQEENATLKQGREKRDSLKKEDKNAQTKTETEVREKIWDVSKKAERVKKESDVKLKGATKEVKAIKSEPKQTLNEGESMKSKREKKLVSDVPRTQKDELDETELRKLQAGLTKKRGTELIELKHKTKERGKEAGDGKLKGKTMEVKAVKSALKRTMNKEEPVKSKKEKIQELEYEAQKSKELGDKRAKDAGDGKFKGKTKEVKAVKSELKRTMNEEVPVKSKKEKIQELEFETKKSKELGDNRAKDAGDGKLKGKTKELKAVKSKLKRTMNEEEPVKSKKEKIQELEFETKKSKELGDKRAKDVGYGKLKGKTKDLKTVKSKLKQTTNEEEPVKSKKEKIHELEFEAQKAKEVGDKRAKEAGDGKLKGKTKEVKAVKSELKRKLMEEEPVEPKKEIKPVSDAPKQPKISMGEAEFRKLKAEHAKEKAEELKKRKQQELEEQKARKLADIQAAKEVKAVIKIQPAKEEESIEEKEPSSQSELDVENCENKRNMKGEMADIIIGEKILKYKPSFLEPRKKEGVVPILFQSLFREVDSVLLPEIEPLPLKEEPAGKTILDTLLSTKENKRVDSESNKGIIRYALSDRSFIDKGWTMLPTEKVVRKMNVYRMRPAHPEFDWFEHNKNKRMMNYDSGEKLAEFDDNGRGRWYYKNGRLALDYYDAEETNAQQRFVIYSSGEPDERGRTHPITILATFDYLGNGIVFDHAGKIRLKYNQTEGVVLDRGIGPVSHWKWHTLNDPPVLQQVMIDTQMAHKDPAIFKLGPAADTKVRPDNEEMLAIEFDNFIKEKSKKLSQKFKPFQIKMKALKINEHFSLRVLDQATIYLIFRDGSTNLKLNIGMILDHQEIVDTDTAEVGEVSNNIERFPARTDSLAGMQRSVAYAQRYERQRTERERRLRRPEPCASADQLRAAASPPMRPPLRTMPIESTTSGYCNCRKPANNLYYNTRLL